MKIGVIKRLLILFFGLVFTTCQSTNTNELVENNAPVFPFFEHFPKTQFNTLSLGENLPDVQQKLMHDEFTCIDSSGAYHYHQTKDSIRVIIPDKQTVSSFKVFLFAKKWLDKKNELIKFLETEAIQVEKSAVYYAFHYQTNALIFKLTLFIQINEPRLYFEEKIKK